MATFTGTTGGDVADATAGTLTGFSGGTVGELQDGTGDTFNAGGGGADSILAGNGADTLFGGAGADTLGGGFGNDTFRYTSASEITGDSIDGSFGTDTLSVEFSGTADFSAATIFSSGFNSIERLAVQSAGAANIIFDASQFNGNGGLSTSLAINEATGGLTVTFNKSAPAASSTPAAITFEQGAAAFVFNAANPPSGTAGAEITGTSLVDTVNGGTGRDTINGSAGNDDQRGGGEDDTFFYTQQCADRLDTIDGGANTGGNGDTLAVAFTGLADFRNATILSTGATPRSSSCGIASRAIMRCASTPTSSAAAACPPRSACRATAAQTSCTST